jgi:uncharacterized membrane protein
VNFAGARAAPGVSRPSGGAPMGSDGAQTPATDPEEPEVSDLIVIAYDDKAAADQASARVEELGKSGLRLYGLAVVSKDAQGQSHVDTPGAVAGVSAAGGALFGSVFGLLFLVPFLGAAVGGAIGALWGAMRQHGVDDEFRKQVNETLKPGSAALVVMTGDPADAAFTETLGAFGGRVMRTSLSAEDERALIAEVGEG